MNEYIVVICCLTKEYHKQLPSLLLDKGYTVSTALTNNIMTQTNNAVTNIIYKLGSDLASASTINDDVKFALSEIKAYFYSLSVFAVGEGSISIGNIDGEVDITRVLKQKSLW